MRALEARQKQAEAEWTEVSPLSTYATGLHACYALSGTEVAYVVTYLLYQPTHLLCAVQTRPYQQRKQLERNLLAAEEAANAQGKTANAERESSQAPFCFLEALSASIVCLFSALFSEEGVSRLPQITAQAVSGLNATVVSISKQDGSDLCFDRKQDGGRAEGRGGKRARAGEGDGGASAGAGGGCGARRGGATSEGRRARCDAATTGRGCK
eukprot:229037-Rhodomonas_salina.1